MPQLCLGAEAGAASEVLLQPPPGTQLGVPPDPPFQAIPEQIQQHSRGRTEPVSPREAPDSARQTSSFPGSLWWDAEEEFHGVNRLHRRYQAAISCTILTAGLVLLPWSIRVVPDQPRSWLWTDQNEAWQGLGCRSLVLPTRQC